MIEYSENEKIRFSLKEKIISKEHYSSSIKSSVRYGKERSSAKVSVIIVAYNEGDDLIRNLEYWKNQTEQGFETILVDNGLDDEIIEKAKEFDVLHIKSKENLGCCGGRNLGTVYANTDILIFGDADGYNPDDYVKNVLDIMRDEKIVAVRGKVLPIDDKRQKEFMPPHYDLGNEQMSSLLNTEGNSAWRKTDYIRAGGFENSLAGAEGLVLQYRMIEFMGYNRDAFVYNPQLLLYHDYHKNDSKLAYKVRQNTIVNIQLKIRYPFWDNFIEYYLQIPHLKKNVPLIGNVDMINVRISKMQGEVDNNYRHINMSRKDERYKNSQLIKGGRDKNFSIIIPCYNLGSLLPKAIDSVFAQTLDDIEVIVVDDASPDEETQKVLDEVEKNVHVVRLKENGGVSVARNKGIEIAKSEYILCLDADDTIEPTYLEKAKNVFDADENVGIVSCGVRSFGMSNEQYFPEDHITLKDALVDCPVHTASCFRKSLHDANRGFDIKLRGYEDWDHWIRIMQHGCDVRVLPDYLFRYYVRDDSKVETSNRNAYQLVRSIVENHRMLYEEYFDYVIAKKHEKLAESVNRHRKELLRAQKSTGIKIHSSKDIVRLAIKAKKKFFPSRLF